MLNEMSFLAQKISNWILGSFLKAREHVSKAHFQTVLTINGLLVALIDQIKCLKLSVTFLTDTIRFLRKISPFASETIMLSIICLKLERHCNKEDICLLDWEETIRFIQANDTDLHDHLKGRHRNKEMALMLNILEVDKDKVPSPSREHMIAMPLAAWKKTDVDFIAVFKKFL